MDVVPRRSPIGAAIVIVGIGLRVGVRSKRASCFEAVVQKRRASIAGVEVQPPGESLGKLHKAGRVTRIADSWTQDADTVELRIGTADLRGTVGAEELGKDLIDRQVRVWQVVSNIRKSRYLNDHRTGNLILQTKVRLL